MALRTEGGKQPTTPPHNPALEPRLLRAREVAQYLGLAPSTVYALIAGGTLPSVRIGTAIRVDRVMLDRWLEQQSAIDHDV